MSNTVSPVRGPSSRAAQWLVFAALCAGVPIATWVFVIVIAPVWVQLLVVLAASDLTTVAVVAVQIALYLIVLRALAWLLVRIIDQLPVRTRTAVLATACVALLAPLCFRSYALCYSSCQHLSATNLIAQIQESR